MKKLVDAYGQTGSGREQYAVDCIEPLSEYLQPFLENICDNYSIAHLNKQISIFDGRDFGVLCKGDV